MSNSEPIDPNADLHDAIDQAVADAAETQGWDDFWAEVQRQEADERKGPPTQVIRGVTVRVPHDLPLLFERKTDQLKDSGSEDAFKELLADLFGVDVLDAWIAAGMSGREFEVVLAWGMANGKGRELSFREAYEMVRDKQQSGKAKSSTPRTGGSGSTGRSSKPTSGASTSSRRGK
ncbi:hypothetical protein ACIBHY_17140 [Nonomuraea sp. NPDC050547]|uniref:hypothetical protein n=1 Tax=Nonomuraea sp. NPDC050547 TaxID=3364368 RepID=UPI0037954F8E